MVFTNFKVFQGARQQTTSVVKALGHNGGTLFHASQSGYAVSNNPLTNIAQSRRNKADNRQNKPFTTQAGSGTIAERVALTAEENYLGPYLAAWQRHQGGVSEWKQYQFQKRIAYKGPAGEAKVVEKREDARPELGRAHTSSAVEDIKDAEAAADEAIAVDRVNRDIAAAITRLHRAELSRVASEEVESQAQAETSATTQFKSDDAALDEASIGGSSTVTTFAPPQSSATEAVNISPTSSQEANLFTERLSHLCRVAQYDEIPAVFELMLHRGLLPSASAYNALITAAYHLPASRHQVVPKVLDVYSDMLRRGVTPDSATYTLLLEIMAVRALEVLTLKRELSENKLRYAAFQDVDKYLFPAHEAEFEISADEDVLGLASKIFKVATAGPQNVSFAAETYRVLLQGYSEAGNIDGMIRVYSHMESGKIVPIASTFPSMIRAFGISGDLRSAVECYTEYRNLAMADNNGKFTLIDRADYDVYSAVVESYLACDKKAGAEKFVAKIVNDLHGKAELQTARDIIASQSFIKAQVAAKQYAEALATVEEQGLSGTARDSALRRICTSAADGGQTELAIQAFNIMSPAAQALAAPPLVVMHIRNNDLDAARNLWSSFVRQSPINSAIIPPAALFVSALMQRGSALEGVNELRYIFDRIRANDTTKTTADKLDNAFAFVAADLARKGTMLPGPAALGFVRAMLENQGLLLPVTEQLLAGLGPQAISDLNVVDLELALQIQADIVRGQPTLDVGHGARFATMLDVAMARTAIEDPRTLHSIENALPRLASGHSDIVARWNARHVPTGLGMSPPVLISSVASPVAEGFDPYAANLDHHGSILIIDELDRQGTRAGNVLNEALTRFKNIRRAGRHPRYIAYAKLITVAARDGRINLIHDIFGMAQHDMPLQPQFPVVRHGWISILDSMVAACLTIGNRSKALYYHQQLLDIGAAPSANTFGLYITTLKESAKIFDEATEAVHIFQRAKSEGVEPSSFLYNALIGKLGRARRIDDCLFYFSEMRQLGIRPTSVTYGTIVNALCRVSDERFAIELFDEMESMPNYKPRPAPYNSMMQFFLTTKRDLSMVLEYYSRMLARGIQPTMHTYKLLIDTYATLEPVNLPAAEGVLDLIRSTGKKPEPVHYAALIHANGCALHNVAGARAIFDKVLSDSSVNAHSCLYQALLESMVANHVPMSETAPLLQDMRSRRVHFTPYIANTLIHGWAGEGNLEAAQRVYEELGLEKREPSTYEAMTKACLSVDARDNAQEVVREMLSRGFPAAVSGKVLELLGRASSQPVTEATQATAT